MTRSLSRILISTIAALGAAGCSSAEQPVPEPSTSTSEALHGGERDEGDPAVGMLLSEGDGLCTGTLIAPSVVLTAAHCLSAQVRGFYTGTGSAVLTGNKIDVSKMVKHDVDDRHAYPGYPLTGQTPCPSPIPDVGIIHLAAPVTDITPVGYAKTPPNVADSCIAVGYGLSGVPGSISQTVGEKRSGTLSVLSLSASNLSLARGTGWPDHGDSGGPLLCMGAVSSVASCGNPDPQGYDHKDEYYARVDAVAGWIDSWLTAWSHPCYEYTVCVVRGHEVLPGPDDDPETWCASVGGTKRKKYTCQ